MGRFDDEVLMALEEIRDNGQTVTWTTTPIIREDENEPWKQTSGQSETFTVSMVFLPINKEQQETLMLSKEGVPDGAVMAYMAVTPFTPMPTDTVSRDGTILSIESINTLAPNGQVILHTLILKT